MKRACLAVILVTSLISTTQAQDSSLVGWWEFEEGSGSIAYDSSGNEHHGILCGDPKWVVTKTGMGLEFDGVDDYVDTLFIEDLPQWTVSVRVKSPNAPSDRTCTGPVHREENFRISWDHTDPAFRGAAAICVKGWYSASFGVLEANTWYHLTATYDGETLKAYLHRPDLQVKALTGIPLVFAAWLRYLTGIGDDGKPANTPAGALINKLSMAFYPVDAQPL